MKVKLEYEFHSYSDLCDAIEQIKENEAEHIKASGCKEPGNCGETHQIWWLRRQLEKVKEYLEEDYKDETVYTIGFNNASNMVVSKAKEVRE